MMVGFKLKFGNTSYVLNPDDIITLLRAVYREGPNYEAVVWSLLKRFAFYYGKGKYNTLAGLIKAYAQPINPDWFPDGKEHLKWLKTLSGNEKDREISNANKRVEYSKTSEDQIPTKIKNIVYGVLNGSISDLVPGSVHYIASRAPIKGTDEQAKEALTKFLKNRKDLSYAVIPQREPTSIKSGFNWFFSSPGTENFRIYPSLDTAIGQEYLVNAGLIDAPGKALVMIIGGALAYKLAEMLSKEKDLSKFLEWVGKYE